MGWIEFSAPVLQPMELDCKKCSAKNLAGVNEKRTFYVVA
jgi:hypothetical protein